MSVPRIGKFAVFALITIFLGACSNPGAGGILDPHEAHNRRVHEANKRFDQGLFGPASQAYGKGIPQPVRQSVGNFASNVGLPGKIVNNVLQLNLEDAVLNSLRFAMNSTFGIGGLFDPATEMGLAEHDTDFGETLYKWGVPEGNYVELPILGPSTERHMIGRAVDLFTNPLSHVIDPPESHYVTATTFLSKVDERYTYSSTIDSLLYESEDSYTAARRLYLDNRRFELGIETPEEEIDEIELLFLELYGE